MNAESHTGWLQQLHILLALGVMAAYAAVPFTVLRRLPIRNITRVSGTLFFITCALTHLALAAGFDDSDWMIVSDVVQLAAVATFIVSLSRQVAWTLRRKEARDKERSL